MGGSCVLTGKWRAVEVVSALQVVVPDNAPPVVTLIFGVASVLMVPGMHGADVVPISSHSSLGKSDALPTAVLAGFCSQLMVMGMLCVSPGS